MSGPLDGLVVVGTTGEAEWVVGEEHLATHGDDTRRRVFSTPSLLAIAELASSRASDDHLPEGWLTVGTAARLRHLAVARPGEIVRAQAVVDGVEGRRIRYSFRVTSGDTLLGDGEHERAAVDLERFVGEEASAT